METEITLDTGVALYNRGAYSSALSCFFSLPEDSDADAVELCYYIGLCYFKLEQYEDSLTYLEQVVTSYESSEDEEAPDRVLQCRYILAIIYYRSGRKRLSEFELEHLVKSEYRTSSVYASLAYLAWDKGDVSASVDYYEKALENDSENLTALNGLGYVLACKGEQLSKALNYCKKAVDASPKSSACMDSLGWVYYKMGLYNEAEDWLRKALARTIIQHDGEESATASEEYDVISAHLEEVRQAENI